MGDGDSGGDSAGSSAGGAAARRYDLTGKLAGQLDAHLVFPLLEFAGAKQLYGAAALARTKWQLALRSTHMVDYAADVWREANGGSGDDDKPLPAEFAERRAAVVAELTALAPRVERVVRLLGDDALVRRLRQEKDFHLEYLRENHAIGDDDVDALFRYAKFQFECGQYADAAKNLAHYRALAPAGARCAARLTDALWGKYAAEILLQRWDDALDTMRKLKDAIDAKPSAATPLAADGLPLDGEAGRAARAAAAAAAPSPLELLQQRAWFVHYSLFVFFNHPGGRNGVVDLLLGDDAYMNAVQTVAPHVLRYLAVAVVTSKRRRNALKDVVRVLRQEAYEYRDPVTELLECLYVRYDFDGAQAKLRECDTVLLNDFFLVACRDEFVESARLFIFETYCRIHQKIDIGMLAGKLNMDAGAAERWIVNLVRNARLDAKIDSAANHVVMGANFPTVYQQVIDKTKGLSFRSYVLANHVGRVNREAAAKQQPGGGGGAAASAVAGR